MSEKINTEIVTPEALLFSEEAKIVVIPGEEGEFGVLEKHAPLISTVKTGVLIVETVSGEKKEIFLSGGFAEVTPDRCTILATEAIETKNIKNDTLKQRIDKANDIIKKSDDIREQEKAQAEIALVETMRSYMKSA